jgi:hypothetical protein
MNISIYDPKGPVAMALKMESAGMAYIVPGSGRVVIISVHQAINLPHLPYNLLNPMQMRLNDVVVNETPKFQFAIPTNLSHTIAVNGENINDELIIPLDLRGLVSCFTTRKSTQEEIDTCNRYELTYESPIYDPSRSLYAEQEAAMTDSRGQLKVVEDKHPLRRHICHVHMAETLSAKSGSSLSSWSCIPLPSFTLIASLYSCRRFCPYRLCISSKVSPLTDTLDIT